jgi:hypothetical protein
MLYLLDKQINMFDWIKDLPKESRGSVYAAMIVSIVSLVTVVATFFIKDYFIPVLLENRKKQTANKDAFTRYKTPLLRAARSLSLRILEIFRGRSYFLLQDAPATEFYRYKYISTIYRLCALLGWIRAIQLETINIVVTKRSDFAKMEAAQETIVKSLADGQHIEEQIVRNLCAGWNIDLTTIESGTMRRVGFDIDNLIQEFGYLYKKAKITELDEIHQRVLLNKITSIIQNRFQTSNPIDIDIQFADSIREVSVQQGLLYRDWQVAIGDLMIEKIDKSIRSYDIISFRKFEEMCENGNAEEKKWIKRAERLFSGIDITVVEDRFDTRVSQLKKVQEATASLVQILEDMETRSWQTNLKKWILKKNKLSRCVEFFQSLLI